MLLVVVLHVFHRYMFAFVCKKGRRGKIVLHSACPRVKLREGELHARSSASRLVTVDGDINPALP